MVQYKLSSSKSRTLRELTEEYEAEIFRSSGKKLLRICDIMKLLGGVSRNTAVKYVAGVPKFADTKMYRSVDLAAVFAERTLYNGG